MSSNNDLERFDRKYQERGVPGLRELEKVMRNYLERDNLNIPERTKKKLRDLLSLALHEFCERDRRPSVEVPAYFLIAMGSLIGLSREEVAEEIEKYETAVKEQPLGTVFRHPYDHE